MANSEVLPKILAMSPESDHQEIARLSAGIDFPWDTRRAYEIALLKTFAVPESSRLLVSTREFLDRTVKRHDDTVAIISTLGLEGYDSEAGRTALRIMNRAHAGYAISQQAFRYTLSLFVLESIRWNERFGWRPLSEIELQAGFRFWVEVGKRMGIRDLPPTLEAMHAESLAFEQSHVTFDPANRELLDATVRGLASSFLPTGWGASRVPVAWLLGQIAPLMGPTTARAFGLPTTTSGAPRAIERLLHVRARVLRRLPARTRMVGVPRLPTHPDGVQWNQVGPEFAREEPR